MTISPNLNGRIAVITGASSGIGGQTARALAARGATVALLARRADRLDAIVKDIKNAGGKATAHAVDVTDSAALEAVAAAIKAELGSAGIVFNNAGIMLPTPIAQRRADHWRGQVDLNITALNTVISAFVDQLVESAQSSGVADLINTASIAGKNVFPTFSVYAASKAYVIHLGNNLRCELGPKDVRVTTIEPGIVDTELQSHIPDQNVKDRLAGTRKTVQWLTPADVADVVSFTVSLPRHVNLSEIEVLPTRQA
jgi:NADP-dependent 3-hydroxy acid dehydrogenase YdfG